MAKAASPPPLTEMERVLIDMLDASPVSPETLAAVPEGMLMRLTVRLKYHAWTVAYTIARDRPDVFPRWLRVVFLDTRPNCKYFECIRVGATYDPAFHDPVGALIAREVAACISSGP
jgi:hypothetical protein